MFFFCLFARGSMSLNLVTVSSSYCSPPPRKSSRCEEERRYGTSGETVSVTFSRWNSPHSTWKPSSVKRYVNMLAGTQIPLRQKLLETLKRPFGMRRINRVLHSVQLNLTRNSGYYALVSSLMCLCLIGLRSSVDTHDHDDIESELHYTFHNWEPKVNYLFISVIF